MTEEPGTFIMDSGPFLDIIPTLLSYLNLQSLVHLAQTCRFWKERIYNDLKLWPNVIELPYIGRMHDNSDRRNDPETVVKVKLWSMVLPPEDPKALEKVLGKMASSMESVRRFGLVEKVLFKNFIHTDESLRLTALLFPSIKEISFEGDLIKCNNLDLSNVCRLFNTEEHKQNLERVFIYKDNLLWHDSKLPTKDDSSFMALCQRCGLYFNELKNGREMLCLYHPGKYDGYGHSCSSFSCCGSSTPRYSSTLGCQYTYHEKCAIPSSSSNRGRTYELHDGHPEYMFQRYRADLFPLCFTERRDLAECYQKWNEKHQQEDEQ